MTRKQEKRCVETPTVGNTQGPAHHGSSCCGTRERITYLGEALAAGLLAAQQWIKKISSALVQGISTAPPTLARRVNGAGQTCCRMRDSSLCDEEAHSNHRSHEGVVTGPRQAGGRTLTISRTPHRLIPAVSMRIECQLGVAWVTVEGDSQDHVLTIGQVFCVVPHAPVLIVGCPTCRVAIATLRPHQSPLARREALR